MRHIPLSLLIVLAVGMGGCSSGSKVAINPTPTPAPTPSPTPTPTPTPAPIPSIALRTLSIGTGASAKVYDAGFLVTNLTGVDLTVPTDQQSFVPTLSSNLVRVENTTTSAATVTNSSFVSTFFFQQLSSFEIPKQLQTLEVRFQNTGSFAAGQSYTPDKLQTQIALYYQKTAADASSFVGYVGQGGTVRIVDISSDVMTVAVENVAMEPYLTTVLGKFTLTAVVKIPYK